MAFDEGLRMISTNVVRNVVTAPRDMSVRHIFGVQSSGWVNYSDVVTAWVDGIGELVTPVSAPHLPWEV
jgi:capsid protein